MIKEAATEFISDIAMKKHMSPTDILQTSALLVKATIAFIRKNNGDAMADMALEVVVNDIKTPFDITEVE